MSAASAVFLSYASQDAEAARRIAEALRAAGVEVWFDQNELVGGDQWDSKIRGQIASCALFVPVISASTQARREGYFRLEWKLAAQRTHMMSERTTFLLPVIIDATRDAEADVPGEFKAVQWTRLPGGETAPAFVARVRKLLGGEPASTNSTAATPVTGIPLGRGASIFRSVGFWVGLAVCGMLVAYRAWRPAEKPVPTATPPVAGDASASELSRVRARIIPGRWQREDFAAVSSTLDRLIQANPEESDAWALRSIINSLQVLRNFDSGTKPLEEGKAAADRAARLAPGSPLADLAMGLHLIAMTSRGGDGLACRPYIDRGLAGLPADALTRYAELVSYWFPFDIDRVLQRSKDWLEVEPKAALPAWVLSQAYTVRRQPDEAEKWAEVAGTDTSITGVRAWYALFESRYYLRADLRGATEALQRVPADGRSVHRVVHGRWLLAMAEHRWDDALQELSQLPETFLFDRAYQGPKALLAALAHRGAGRTEAAAAQLRDAERLLKEQLLTDPANEALHLQLAVTLAYAGREAEARSELAQVEPLVQRRAPTLYRGELVLLLAQTHAALGDPGPLAVWLRKLLTEPSQFPFTPASIRLDPRFAAALDSPEIQALLKEFALLDQPAPAAAAAALPVADQKSVAVLPFANLSGDKEQEYFSDGLTEEILNTLARERDLRVPGRTSSFSFKGKNVSSAEIAKALNVARLVEGSVRKSGNKVRISVSLTRAADGFSEELGTFTEELSDVFALQDKVARAVVEKLTHRTVTIAAVGLTRNAEAYEAYLKGRALQTRSADFALQAAALYEQAVALDPTFALAWARLAEARFRAFGAQLDRSPDVIQGTRRAIDQALAAQPDLPEALIVRANWIRSVEYDYPAAQRDLERAEALQPATAELRMAQGSLARDQLSWSEATRRFREALQLDPQNGDNANAIAVGLYLPRGDYVEADQLLRRAMAIQGPSVATPMSNLAFVRNLWRGPEAALRLLDRMPANQAGLVERRVSFLLSLDRLDEARVLADKLDLTIDGAGKVFLASGAVAKAGLLRALGRDEEARRQAQEIVAVANREFVRGNHAPLIRTAFIRGEIVLGHRESALAALQEWREEAQRMPSTYRRLQEFVTTATALYAKLGLADESVALLHELKANGFIARYGLRYNLDFDPIRNDPRIQELVAEYEAWAKTLPDPVDL